MQRAAWAMPSRSAGSAGEPVLECGDEREADLFDDRGRAVAREGGFSGGEIGSEWALTEDVGYPAGEVVAEAVVPQDALVAGCQLGFQLGQVGGNGPGGGAWLGREVEPVGDLNACLVVFVLVAQVSGYPGTHGEGHCLA